MRVGRMNDGCMQLLTACWDQQSSRCAIHEGGLILKRNRKLYSLSTAMTALLLVASLVSAAVLPAAPAGAAGTTAAGPSDAVEVQAFLDEFFAGEAVRAMAPGAAVSVVRGESVLAAEGYGQADAAGGEVDPDNSVFRIASVSKLLTAAAIMQLADQGKLSLQDDIEKHLGGYELDNPFDAPVTIEMLLLHTTGFEGREPTEANFLYDPSQQPMSLEEHVLGQFPPVVREPGTSFKYDNFAYALQGYIIEQVSGKPFAAYMEDHIFQPLGMESTSFDAPADIAGRLVDAFTPDGQPMPPYRISPEALPEGSAITTAADMAKFMTMFVSGGRTPDGTVILSEQAIADMLVYRSHVHEQLPDGAYGFDAPYPHALGNGQDVFLKGGDVMGFSSLIWFVPQSQVGVFITYNTNGDLRYALYEAFMDRYYPGDAPALGKADFVPAKQAELAQLEGLYTDLRLNRILTRVAATGDGELTVLNAMSGMQTLKQVDELLFVDPSGAPLAFKRNEAGDVIWLRYSNPGAYSVKVGEPEGFADVQHDDPYASYILTLQALGLLEEPAGGAFGPEEAVSRGSFVHIMSRAFELGESESAPALRDIADSPYAKELQAAYEFGFITGTPDGLFAPDRAITREEAAVITHRLLLATGVPSQENVQLVPGTSPWAETAVKTVVTYGFHGPEVTATDGVYDYQSKQPLTKRELAVLLYKLYVPVEI